MIVVGDYARARPQRRAVTILTGDVFGRTDIVAEGTLEDPGPHAFLVEQAPDVVLPAHFHRNDQFQVAVAGRGTLGRRPLAPVTVHFARGTTGYGPIVAGPQGLHYLTLRARLEYGAHYLMDPATVVDRTTPKFHATSPIAAPASGDTAEPRTSRDVQMLLAPDADGMGAWFDRLPPGDAPWQPPDAHGIGRFRVVITGEATGRDGSLCPMSCVWETGDETGPSLVAGARGAEIVTVQFPRPR